MHSCKYIIFFTGSVCFICHGISFKYQTNSHAMSLHNYITSNKSLVFFESNKSIFFLLLYYCTYFYKVTVPCPTCLPCKNRFTILSHSEHYHFLLYTVLGGWDRGVTCRQETNPPEVVKEDLLGPGK